MLAGATYMFGAGYCLRQGAHVRVDFIYSNMSPKLQAAVDIGGYVMLLLPGLLWLDFGLYEYAQEAFVTGEVTGE